MTSKEFAKEIGVTQCMVSRALNDSNQISEEKAQYIKKKAEEFGFVLNAQARSLRTKKTGTVGIIFPKHFVGMSYNRGLAFFFDVVQRDLMKLGYDVLVIYDREENNKVSSIERIAKCYKVDGLIDLRLECSESEYAVIKKYNVPCVFLLNSSNNDPMQSSCLSDSEYGGFLAGSYLGKFKEYRPIYIDVADTADSKIRLKGYQKGLNTCGRTLSSNDILGCNISVKDAYDCVIKNKKLFTSGKLAVFAFNDLVAYGVIRACKSLDLKVPETIQVLGMDGLPITNELPPFISTIDICDEETSKAGCQMLKELIDNSERTVRHISILPKLIIKDTTLPEIK